MKSLPNHLPWSTWGRPESFTRIMERVAAESSLPRLFKNKVEIRVRYLSRNAHPESITLQKELLRLQSFQPQHTDYESDVEQALKGLEIKTPGARGGTLFLSPDVYLHPSACFEIAKRLEKEKDTSFWLTSCHNVFSTPFTFNKSDPDWFSLLHGPAMGCGLFLNHSLLQQMDPQRSLDEIYPLWDLALTAIGQKTPWKTLAQTFLYENKCPSLKYNPHQAKVMLERHLQETQQKHKAHIYLPAASKREVFYPQDGGVETYLLPLEKSPAQVTAIVCFRDEPEMTIRAIKSLLTVEKNLKEVILVNNESTPTSVEWIQKALAPYESQIRLIDYPHAFNYAGMHNKAMAEVSTPFVLLLNNDVIWQKSTRAQSHLELMQSWMEQDDEIVSCGMRLEYPDGRLQHAGFKVTLGEPHRMLKIIHNTDPHDFANSSHLVLGNTFAACLVRKSFFDSLGGLNTLDYPNGLGDVAFHLEAKKRGKKSIYLAALGATHLESASRGVREEFWEECGVEEQLGEIYGQIARKDFGINHNIEKPLGFKALVKRSVLGRFLKTSALGQLFFHSVRSPHRALNHGKSG